jgi:hypothetical protein
MFNIVTLVTYFVNVSAGCLAPKENTMTASYYLFQIVTCKMAEYYSAG